MSDPIHPLQAMIDGMSAAWQKERAKTQMTLGALIRALEGVDLKRKVVGLGAPMSYRGYYSDLSFLPNEEPVTVQEALKAAKDCMGRVFEGYKGGDFQMGEQTPIWSAQYGDCGPRIMALDLTSDPIRLVLAKDGPAVE